MSFTSLVGQPLPLSCEGLAHQTSLLHDFSDFIEVYHCKNKRVSLTYLRLPVLHSYRIV